MFFFIIFAIATTQMFNGMLKQRCIAIQTGINHPDDIICNVNDENSCPGGYFCGKGSENPNYGVTNFDNIAYSILAVFQCLTLEGWSEIQRDMQRSFTTIIYLMFIPMVLIGAFFLLNLTLAVINSKFTEMNNKQQQ
jgi:voltage-dependent calcium channel L type alpha-1D